MGNNVFSGPFSITSAAINAALSGQVLNGVASVNIGATGYYAWSGLTVMKAPESGGWSLRNFAETIQANQVVEANDILAQRRGTNAQMSRLYNTYTDASNYERAHIGWIANVFTIDPQNAAGTGTASRPLALAAGGTILTLEGSSSLIGYAAPFAFQRNGTSASTLAGFGNTAGSGYTSTALNLVRLTTAINQASGTYNLLDLNPTETLIGAGPHYLARGRIGAGANVFGIRNTGALETASYMQMGEIADPAAPATNFGLLYMRDNGSGKTQVVARFPTGAIQVIATEP